MSSKEHVLRILKNRAGDGNHCEHGEAKKYLIRYQAIEQYMRENINSVVDTGLATQTILKRGEDDGTRFTRHGPEHVAQLIQCLDKLVYHSEIRRVNRAIELTSLEAFCLLCAAQFHDTANAASREQHTKLIRGLLSRTEIKPHIGSIESDYIADIAEAHGGSHEFHGPDTFAAIQDHSDPRLPYLAALLRLADELAEGPDRVDEERVRVGKVNEVSSAKIAFARSFTQWNLQDGALALSFKIDPDHCVVGDTTISMAAYLCEFEKRMEKLELETIYCCQYGRPHLDISAIKVVVRLFDQGKEICECIKFSISLISGYPAARPPLAGRCSELKMVSADSIQSLILGKYRDLGSSIAGTEEISP